MKNLLFLGLIAVLAACGKPAKGEARPGTGTGATPGACRYATDNGCAAANKNGLFHNPSLLTSAQQSGQNSLLPRHPMMFNIPGVDYPIGPDKTLTPKDPRTISAANCFWNHTGRNAPPNDYIKCAPISNGDVVSITLDNYDFSGTKIGQPAISLYIQGCGNGCVPGPGSKVTVTNSYFAITPTVNPMAWGGNGAANWSVKFWNNQCDGTSAASGSGFCFRSDADSAGTSFDARYNVFSNQSVGRIAGGMHYMTFTLRYNYISGLNSLNTGNHGELMLRSCSSHGCTSFDDYEGNFIVWTPGTVAGVDNATIFPGDGASDGIALSSVSIINNIIVTNSRTGGNGVINQALFNARLASMGAVVMTGNWIDASGSDDCSINGVKAGGSTVTASSSGNTLNVTALSGSFGNNPIEPGWSIFHSGFTTATITAYGTGGGNTGTYTFSGSPQTLGSDRNWTLVPGFTSFTASDNWGLADPSHRGIPVALGLNGPQFTATHCPPIY